MLSPFLYLAQSGKISGVSFVAPAKKIGDTLMLLPKTKVAANFLRLMPYRLIPEGSTGLKFGSEWQWWGEKMEGTLMLIQIAKKQGYKIMLKPHVWKRCGSFTGHHGYETNQEWKSFEAAYSNYILTFAKLAQEEKVELFCIGTEWGKFVEQRPEYWKQLIREVKRFIPEC